MPLADCGHYYPSPPKGIGGVGYARDAKGKTACYECCAARDRAEMECSGTSKRLPLYLSRSRVEMKDGSIKGGSWKVTNWPGTLRFPVNRIEKGQHNIAGTRTDVWFKGPDYFWWHGTLYGENTQIVHCKRTKVEV